jgi:DNA-binding NtrC family response regulator
VALLATRQLARLAEVAGRKGMHFTREALDALGAYDWPGNVRELVNVCEYAVALTRGDAVDVADLPAEIAAPPAEGTAQPAEIETSSPSPVPAVEDEAAIIREALEANGWHRIRTAAQLGIDRVTLYRKMKRLGITGPRGRRSS